MTSNRAPLTLACGLFLITAGLAEMRVGTNFWNHGWGSGSTDRWLTAAGSAGRLGAPVFDIKGRLLDPRAYCPAIVFSGPTARLQGSRTLPFAGHGY